jgi:hypothetical protein
LLTQNALILGGGAGATPSAMASLGTTTTVLHGNAAGAPTFGAVVLTTDVSGILPLANGDTSANLTANNGGIFYSTASAGAILAGTATARQMLQSGATATPAWSTATWPATTTINQLLYSSAGNTVTGLTTANGGVLNTSSSGVPSITNAPVLGLAGTSVGTVGLQNLTSGTITISPPTGALGSVTNTLQAAADTFVYRATTDTLTNKTITSSTNVLGGVTMTLGSDATGDIYYRSSGGVLTRLPIGSATNVLTVSGGLPAWTAAAGGGNVSNSGTPTTNQVAQWVTSTTIQGVNQASLLTAGAGIAISGTTNATIALALNGAVLQTTTTGLNPTSTTSTTDVMMGLGSTCHITPVNSTRIQVSFSGVLVNDHASGQVFAQIRFGTGTAPANGVAVTGTQVTPKVNILSAVANQGVTYSQTAIITGLTTGTAYWLDIALSSGNVGGSSAFLQQALCAASEVY